MKTIKTSRESFLNLSDTSWHIANPIRESLSYLLFLIFPALTCGCRAPELQASYAEAPSSTAKNHYEGMEKTSVKIEGNAESLDVFTFENDRLERLDSYQRFEKGDYNGNICEIASCSGEKTMIIIANSPLKKHEWIDINCLKSLEKKSFNLEDENPSYPLMTGEYNIKAGEEFQTELIPMAGEVVLRSLVCDFSDKTYSEAKMTDIKIYLTNVNSSCGIWTGDETYPSRIINAGKMSMDDLAEFRYPEIIFREIETDVGRDKMTDEIRLLAYPSSCLEESPGTPFTKLVIEGKINGKTWYYPIAVNRSKHTAEPGIRRNRCYIYDLTITGTGLEDPDGTIAEAAIKVNMEVKKWEEKDWYGVRF